MASDIQPEELLSLADRCEAAKGPDEALDWEVEAAIGDWENRGGGIMRHKVTGEERCGFNHPKGAYTASLDAAMGLVPEGRGHGYGTLPAEDILRKEHHRAQAYVDGGAPDFIQYFHAEAATPALALTAACLRAIASSTGRRG